MTALATYSTGTVSVSDGGTTVTGTGTIWSGVNARPGDIFQIGEFQTIIGDVADVDELTIPPWGGGDQTGVAYTIYQVSPQRFAGAQAMADVSTLVAALNTDGFFFFVDTDETEPDPSLGNDGQYAMQPSTGKVWLKDAGTWEFQGLYKALGVAAAWSSLTAYQVNDVATLDGSSYVCILAHTNHTPPNATYWAVLASKGDTGDAGSTGAPGADAPTYGGTSTTSLTIGTGSKAFTTQAGLAYQNGARVRASSAANTSNWMEGLVTYSGTTLTMTSDKTNGSGTLADWNFNIVGEPGAGDLSSANNLSDVASAQAARGNLGIIYPPQGRLTLQTAVAVMTTTQSAKTTIYYTPYVGNQVPLYDGTKMIPTAFSELSVATTDTTKSPGAIGASKVNDWFVWNDAGTIRLSHGPDWTNDTSRGYSLTLVNGIFLNDSAITNGPAASRGTWVGTTRSNASSQLDWIIGGSASGGVAALLNVWNTYNRVLIPVTVVDAGAAYTYTSATVRQARASAAMQISFVRGLDEDAVQVAHMGYGVTTATTNAFVSWGCGLDSTTAYGRQPYTGSSNAAAAIRISGNSPINWLPGVGYHFIAALEASDGSNANNFNFGTANNLTATIRC